MLIFNLFCLLVACVSLYISIKSVRIVQNAKKHKPLKIRYYAYGDANKRLMQSFKYEEASCFDIEASEAIEIKPWSDALIPTGLCLDLPKEYEVQIRPRSGFSKDKKGIVTLGTVDSDYRGCMFVHLFNFSDNILSVSKFDRIAQGCVCKKGFNVFDGDKFELVESEEVKEKTFRKTARQSNGFGSSGVHQNEATTS